MRILIITLISNIVFACSLFAQTALYPVYSLVRNCQIPVSFPVLDSGKYLYNNGTTMSWQTISGGGSGTVTTLSVVTANGLSGTVANATTTPAITLDVSGLALSKLATIADQRILGNVSGGSTSAIALTSSQISTFLSLGILATLSAAPAGTLTGTTLNSSVVTSSLTSVGTLSALTIGSTSGAVTSNAGALTFNTLAANSILYGAGTTSLTGNSTAFTYNGTVQTITDAIAATTITDGLVLANSNAATSGNQMYSPFIDLKAFGFGTGANTSQSANWSLGVVPVQAATNPTSIFALYSNINGAGNSEKFGITSAGGFRIGSSALSGIIYENGSSVVTSLTGAAGALVLFGTAIVPNSASHVFLNSNQNGLGVGQGITATGSTLFDLHVYENNSTTSAVDNLVCIDHKSTGTPAAGFGSGLLWTLASSTTVQQNAFQIASDWLVATHASRGSELTFSGVFNASALTKVASLALSAATTATFTLGVAGTTTGNLNLVNATGSNAVTLAVPASPSAYTLTLPANGGTNGYFPRTNGSGALTFVTNASYQATPSSPTGTADLTGVMMGLAGSITPNTSGQIIIIVSGDIANSSIGGAKVKLRYGTGTAPTNGAAATGTPVSQFITLSPIGANIQESFSVQGIATGLTVATAYWIDLQVAAMTTGTASVADITISAHEF